jgi:anti-sigma factor RsiW
MHALISRLRFRRDHRWAPDRISAYLDGDLAARPRGRLERHLGECHECRRLLGGLSQVIDALHRLARAEGSGDPARIAASVRLRLHEPPRA